MAWRDVGALTQLRFSRETVPVDVTLGRNPLCNMLNKFYCLGLVLFEYVMLMVLNMSLSLLSAHELIPRSFSLLFNTSIHFIPLGINCKL